MRRISLCSAVLLAAATADSAPAQDRAALMASAVEAAPPSISDHASIMDWEGNVLRQGDNGWTCFPTPPGIEAAPMCLDEPWMKWADAWQKKEPVQIERAGLAYMLLGDGGASNTDPFAEGPTDTNDWVEAGPHLMLIVPDPAMLEGIPTDPESGGPWVMWKGTPYAHVMIPVPGPH